MARVNWSRFFVAMFFITAETNYFGWNFTPQSGAELICDGIGMLMVVLSFERRKA